MGSMPAVDRAARAVFREEMKGRDALLAYLVSILATGVGLEQVLSDIEANVGGEARREAERLLADAGA